MSPEGGAGIDYQKTLSQIDPNQIMQRDGVVPDNINFGKKKDPNCGQKK